MIGNRRLRLLRRTLSTTATVALVVVLVVIYLRSSGKGTGAKIALPVNSSSASRQAPAKAGSSGAGSSSSGPSGSSGAGSPSGAGAGSSASASGGGEPPLRNGVHSSPGGGASGTFTGPVIETPYGPVQVAVAEQGGKIVDVKALQLPTEHPQSLFISERVAPMLRSEALQAQSAEINVVTGATFTSEGFASSLQKALLKAT